MLQQNKLLIASLLISSIMIGCGDSNDTDSTGDSTTNSSMNGSENNTGNDTTPTTRFVTASLDNQNTMQDTTTNLEWVNGMGGCHPMVPGKTESVAFVEAELHCEELVFATHGDWRVPTIEEIQTFTVEMQNEALVPFYQNAACPRVVGYNEDNTTILNTNTHNTNPIGTITPWAELNAGVRCVREQ